MTYFSHISLQQALYGLLTSDATLMGQVVGVFDHVPQGTAMPFVSIGEAVIRDASNLQTRGTEHTISLRIWSREAGRKQASLIMERLVTLLQDANLTISGQTLRLIRFVSSNIQLQEDGLTQRGTLTFRVLMSEG